MTDGDAAAPTVYERVGGFAFFETLVAHFYAGVADDPVLRPLYPEGDLVESRRTLSWFLAQYWGGPTDYSDERGHPRLRMRHAPFTIGQTERDHWLAHMRDAVEASELPTELEAEMLEYFDRAATAMINSPFGFAVRSGPAPTDQGPEPRNA
jgi:hemoglobin